MSVWRLKLKLCLDVVSILCFLHDSRVYDVGLSLDNIVLDDQFKVRLIGLGDYQPKIGSSTPTPPCNAISITRDLHSLSTIFLEICGPTFHPFSHPSSTHVDARMPIRNRI
ncbi:hypothetical protein BC829DRAFT_293528 [Chytridium lagenaria]|nr:hypothetical protein BC829DRAFT_293528 [Chytridium lagenaria]